MRREEKTQRAPKRRPNCYELRPSSFWNPVQVVTGCRNCAFRMSCQNPAYTGEFPPYAPIDLSDDY
jgi:hypothetical protein